MTKKKEEKAFEDTWAYVMEEHGIDSFQKFIDNLEDAYEGAGKYAWAARLPLSMVIEELKNIRDAKVVFNHV